MRKRQISNKKNKTMKGGSGQKQFEVAPIGETGGSSDAQSSIINAKLTQLNAQQTENSKFDGNLEENYDLGAKVGGKKKRKSKRMKSIKKKQRKTMRKNKKGKTLKKKRYH